MEREAKNARTENYHETLRTLLDEYAHAVYDAAKGFPKDEIFGTTSQLKRASISVVLNYIEGYARQRPAVFKTFVETAYGSLKESLYLIDFSQKRGWIEPEAKARLLALGDRAGKMLWGIISSVQ